MIQAFYKVEVRELLILISLFFQVFSLNVFPAKETPTSIHSALYRQRCWDLSVKFISALVVSRRVAMSWWVLIDSSATFWLNSNFWKADMICRIIDYLLLQASLKVLQADFHTLLKMQMKCRALAAWSQGKKNHNLCTTNCLQSGRKWCQELSLLIGLNHHCGSEVIL